MSDQYSPEPKRGRPTNAERDAKAAIAPRVAEIQQRRRRREGLGSERNLKLTVPDDVTEGGKYVTRWINNRPGRVQQFTQQDDWDVVSVGEGSGTGTVTERAVDSYTGEKAVLVRKLKEFHDADQKEKWKALDERDEAMRRGPLPTPEGIGGEAAMSYTPGGRNIVNGR
jgi:hypothetical protein